MKTFSKNALILLGSIFVSTSCHKDEIAVPSNTAVSPTELFTVENDRVAFKTANDFGKQIQALKKLSPSDLISWNDKSNVTSLFEVAQNKEALSANARVSSENQSQADLSDAVNDKYFASLLNSNGEFSIGNKVIRITPNIVFIGNKSLADRIRKLDATKYANLLPNKFIVDQGIIIGRTNHLSNSKARMAFNGVDHTIYNWDGSHRVATVIYNDNWLVYRSIGTKVKFQNKRWWGGWWEDNTDALGLHYAVTYDVSRVTGIQQYVVLTPPSQSCQNCGNITDTIDFDIAETGWGGDGPSISLIDSPFDFKSFTTYSTATWSGNTHNDSLEEDQ